MNSNMTKEDIRTIRLCNSKRVRRDVDEYIMARDDTQYVTAADGRVTHGARGVSAAVLRSRRESNGAAGPAAKAFGIFETMNFRSTRILTKNISIRYESRVFRLFRM